MGNTPIKKTRALFLPTPSARRATAGGPHQERDAGGDFYPRPPRGGRPDGGVSLLTTTGFLPTPSARRATSASRAALLEA